MERPYSLPISLYAWPGRTEEGSVRYWYCSTVRHLSIISVTSSALRTPAHLKRSLLALVILKLFPEQVSQHQAENSHYSYAYVIRLSLLYCAVPYCAVLYCTVRFGSYGSSSLTVRTVRLVLHLWFNIYCTVLYCTVLYCYSYKLCLFRGDYLQGLGEQKRTKYKIKG